MALTYVFMYDNGGCGVKDFACFCKVTTVDHVISRIEDNGKPLFVFRHRIINKGIHFQSFSQNHMRRSLRRQILKASCAGEMDSACNTTGAAHLFAGNRAD